MPKIFLLLAFYISTLFSVNPISLQYLDIKVTHTYLDGSKKDFVITREISKECIDIPMYPESFQSENIRLNIPKNCKKEFITTKGVIQPFIIDEKIKTVGEIEVLDFILNKSSKYPSKYVLIDSRKAIWFKDNTIPSALNSPYEDLIYDEDFKEDFYKAYENLGVKVLSKDSFDFSNAKTVIFFCNASWCPISTKSIKHLIKIGYPKEKIMWYRGGLASWQNNSLSTTKK